MSNLRSPVRLRIWVLRLINISCAVFIYLVQQFPEDAHPVQIPLLVFLFMGSFFALIYTRCENCGSIWFQDHKEQDLSWNKLSLTQIMKLIFSIPKKRCCICGIERI